MIAIMSTNTPACIDALPYIDTAIDDDDDQRAIAMKEVDDELEVFPPDRDYLADLSDINKRPFMTELLEKEFNRLEMDSASKLQVDQSLTDMRVDVPPPASSKMSDEQLELWKISLDQLKIKIEYRHRQLTNLELLKRYGLLAWGQYILESEKLEASLNTELEELGKQTQKVNWLRKNEQEDALKRLQVLQSEWDNLVTRNHQLNLEIQRLSRKDI